MDHIACKACWTRFDVEALSCPQCGRTNPSPRRRTAWGTWWLWAPVGVVVAGLMLYLALAPLVRHAAQA